MIDLNFVWEKNGVFLPTIVLSHVRKQWKVNQQKRMCLCNGLLRDRNMREVPIVSTSLDHPTCFHMKVPAWCLSQNFNEFLSACKKSFETSSSVFHSSNVKMTGWPYNQLWLFSILQLRLLGKKRLDFISDSRSWPFSTCKGHPVVTSGKIFFLGLVIGVTGNAKTWIGFCFPLFARPLIRVTIDSLCSIDVNFVFDSFQLVEGRSTQCSLIFFITLEFSEPELVKEGFQRCFFLFVWCFIFFC